MEVAGSTKRGSNLLILVVGIEALNVDFVVYFRP